MDARVEKVKKEFFVSSLEDRTIDLSGHGEIKIDVRNVASREELEKEAQRLLDLIEEEGYWNALAKKGTIVLVLPGFSPLASVFLAKFHGVYGYFPKIRYYVRDQDTGAFELTRFTVDLQINRYNARRERK